MKSAQFDQAKIAYESGDYAQALRGFYGCLKEDSATFDPGDAGLVYHKLGNCLIKLRSYNEAAATYRKALEDPDYTEKAAVQANLGMALVGLGEYDQAVESFKAALEDPAYETPYRAQMGLGGALMKLGMIVDAGTAYRNAALDETNPNPVKALISLGVCFMALDRPKDAIEAYLAALDFKATGTTLYKTYANLGQAYVAMGRYQEALDAFEAATRDGSYTLSTAAQSDYDMARKMLSGDAGSFAMNVVGNGTREYPMSGLDTPAVDNLFAGYSPQGSGEEEAYSSPSFSYGGGNVPLASDTGFFTATDTDLIAMGKSQMRKERKMRHTGLKVFLVFIVLLVLLLGAAVFAYTQGMGYPSQETVIEDLFEAHAAGEDISPYWIDSDEDGARTINRIMDMVAPTDSITFDYVSREMTESNALVSARLPEGGSIRYDIQLARNMLGWKISGIEIVFASQQ
ncbi:MAG: tetratricopeptide repeat protein [Coriobacteriaceae bacterium]|nr:tetratricopeptide repeat protein [Coriobacteriaceae bacterium]